MNKTCSCLLWYESQMSPKGLCVEGLATKEVQLGVQLGSGRTF
jgi:hypothetical protein